MYCKNCGQQIADGSTYCPVCGSSQSGAPSGGSSLKGNPVVPMIVMAALSLLAILSNFLPWIKTVPFLDLLGEGERMSTFDVLRGIPELVKGLSDGDMSYVMMLFILLFSAIALVMHIIGCVRALTRSHDALGTCGAAAIFGCIVFVLAAISVSYVNKAEADEFFANVVQLGSGAILCIVCSVIELGASYFFLHYWHAPAPVHAPVPTPAPAEDKNTVHCMFCGTKYVKKLPDTPCPNCKKKQPQTENMTPAGGLTCPKCSKFNPKGSVKCSGCGWSFTGGNQPSQPPKKITNKWMKDAKEIPLDAPTPPTPPTTATKFCGMCGKKIPADATVCPYCKENT